MEADFDFAQRLTLGSDEPKNGSLRENRSSGRSVRFPCGVDAYSDTDVDGRGLRLLWVEQLLRACLGLLRWG
ncbi:MAG: hypothetical protein GC161_02175 [Planctomycetaceae bacterium]|nr:hypothetical protein [Planctomycetaceae bacterium]